MEKKWKFNVNVYDLPNKFCGKDLTNQDDNFNLFETNKDIKNNADKMPPHFKPYGKYKKCNLSLEEKMIRMGDSNAKFKIIILYGGPRWEVNNTYIKKMFENKTDYFGNALHWAMYQNVELIMVRQAQYTKVEQFKNTQGLTVEAGKLETKETLDTCHELVKHFKNKGFTVAVLGRSYGAFLALEYIYSYDYKLADAVFVNNGRINTDAFNFFEQYGPSKFETVQSNMKLLTKKLTKAGFNKTFIDWEVKRNERFQTALIKPISKNYMELMKDYDLSNVIFVAGDGDLSVGDFNDKEIKWVKDHKAKLIKASRKEIKEMMNLYKKRSGRDFEVWGYDIPEVAAHVFNWMNPEQVKNNILYNIGWQDKYENKDVDFYNGLK